MSLITVLAAAAAETEAAPTAEGGGITAQQAIAIVVALIVVVGWALYLLANVRRSRAEVGSEIELAANRKPYLDDEALEGPRLERALSWGLVSLAIIGVGLPLYWLAEPNRQAGAVDMMRERREGVTYMHGPGSEPIGGGALFATTEEGGFDCAGCHGGVSGAPVPATLTEPDGTLRQVQWYAPSLDDVTLRMTDDQLRDVLTFGRPFSPMPAWGIEGGGPMNEQQIENIILYLKSVSISPEEARARTDANLETALADLEGTEQAEGLADDDLEGAALFNVHCARCHTKGWSYDEPEAPGAGAFGPSVYNSLQQFPVEEDHIDWVKNGREYGEQYGEQGQSSGRMPYFSQILTDEQIAAVVRYERQLAEEFGDDREAPGTPGGFGPGQPGAVEAGALGDDGGEGGDGGGDAATTTTTETTVAGGNDEENGS